MTVQELAGPQCTDIIVCPQIREADPNGRPSATDGTDGMLTIECSLLALQAIEEAGKSWGGGQISGEFHHHVFSKQLYPLSKFHQMFCTPFSGCSILRALSDHCTSQLRL